MPALRHPSPSLRALPWLLLALATLVAPHAFAADPTPSGVNISLNPTDAKGWVSAIKVFLGLTALTLAPAILMSVTSFTRIVVVLGMLRQAMGAQGLPPTRVLVGLGLFLALFTMAPTLHAIDVNALTPYEAGQIDGKQALLLAMKPLREFMVVHTRADDLAIFLDLAQDGGTAAAVPATIEDVPTTTLVPAFMLSELRTAFQMGAMLFLPFLVIDLLVSSVLMSMGMMMLPPVVVSLPLKLFIFVLADGWGLVVKSLAESILHPAMS